MYIPRIRETRGIYRKTFLYLLALGNAISLGTCASYTKKREGQRESERERNRDRGRKRKRKKEIDRKGKEEKGERKKGGKWGKGEREMRLTTRYICT